MLWKIQHGGAVDKDDDVRYQQTPEAFMEATL